MADDRGLYGRRDYGDAYFYGYFNVYTSVMKKKDDILWILVLCGALAIGAIVFIIWTQTMYNIKN